MAMVTAPTTACYCKTIAFYDFWVSFIFFYYYFVSLDVLFLFIVESYPKRNFSGQNKIGNSPKNFTIEKGFAHAIPFIYCGTYLLSE